MDVDRVAREADGRIVYCGPAGSGKTANLEYLHSVLETDSRGRLITPTRGSERSFGFDFLSVDLGEIRGFRSRLHLYGVPADAGRGERRDRVLAVADAAVLVLDSAAGRMEANRASVRGLVEGLRDAGRDPADVEVVLQYNKRDRSDALPVERLEAALNPGGLRYFEAVAPRGRGVVETVEEVGVRTLAGLETDRGTP